MPVPATVEEAGLVLVVDAAGFEVIPVVDDTGLAAGLVDVVVLDVTAFDVAVVDFLGLAVFAVGLTKVFLGASDVEEGVTRVLEPALLPEDAGFPVPGATSAF